MNDDVKKYRKLIESAEGDVINKSTVKAFADKVQSDVGLKRFNLYLNNGGDLYLTMLETIKEQRKTGKGTLAMGLLTAFADRHGLRIVLTPDTVDGSGTTSVKRLIGFYKRFGFKENKGRNKDYSFSETMYRDPA